MRVRWLRKALRNLDDEASHIAADSPDAAQLVVQRVLEAVAMLPEQPGMGRPGRGSRERASSWCSRRATSCRTGSVARPSRSCGCSTPPEGFLSAGEQGFGRQKRRLVLLIFLPVAGAPRRGRAAGARRRGPRHHADALAPPAQSARPRCGSPSISACRTVAGANLPTRKRQRALRLLRRDRRKAAISPADGGGLAPLRSG